MKRDTQITHLLNQGAMELRSYVIDLEKLNLRLHRQVAKLQAQDFSNQNKIKTLEKGQPKYIYNINYLAPIAQKLN